MGGWHGAAAMTASVSSRSSTSYSLRAHRASPRAHPPAGGRFH